MKEKTRPKAQIVVIDDHPVLRDGLMQLLGSQPDLECTGTADNTADAKRLVAQSAPDLMILDLRLKSGDTLDLIKSLRVEHPDLKVLVLSQYDEMLFAERVLRAGASGYVMKENASDEILNAVRRVLAGDIYFSSDRPGGKGAGCATQAALKAWSNCGRGVRLPDGGRDARRHRRAQPAIAGGRRSDHVHEFVNSRKFSCPRPAVAEGNAHRQHRPDHVKDGARSGTRGRCRSAPARY